ncbi:citrate transporter, partial [Lysinibacillus xylanilyticus]
GYVVTTINSVCNEKHKDAYMPFGALTVIIPIIGTLIAIILFSLGM